MKLSTDENADHKDHGSDHYSERSTIMISRALHLQVPPAGGAGVRHPDHAHIDDLPGGLHGDALELAQTVLKLGGGVRGIQLHHALIQQQLLAGAVVIPVLLLLFPGK